MPAHDSKRTPNKNRDEARRDFVKKLAYVAPVLLTLPASPAVAQVGSAAPTECPPDTFPVFDDFSGTIVCVES